MAHKKWKYISRNFASYCVLLNILIKVVITHIFIAKIRICQKDNASAYMYFLVYDCKR